MRQPNHELNIEMNLKIAVLLTCFNRHSKTIECLNSMAAQILPEGVSLSYYLVDDNSPDQTGKLVKERFPFVEVIQGNGSLFWVGGMRLAWQTAMKNQYDGYLLINDDVQMNPTMIQNLITTNQYALTKYNQTGVYIGSTIDPDSQTISYGGRTLLNRFTGKSILTEPDQLHPKSCDFAHANILLVMNNVVDQIGILNENFTQRLADYDYTLKVSKKALPLLVCPGFCGICKDDHGKNWLPPKSSLKQRIQYLKDPKHLAYHEYLLYMKWHFPFYRPIAFIKLWMKTLFPSLWEMLKS